MKKRISWIRVPILGVMTGAVYTASCSSPDERASGKALEGLTATCSLQVTANSYDGPNYWGTMTISNNGPADATGYTVDFDVPAGVHCTNDAVPAGAALSPLDGASAATIASHCTFAWPNATLASGASLTFNYSTDSTAFSAASNVTVTSASCSGAIDAGVDTGIADANDGSSTACTFDGGVPDDLRCTGLYSDWTRKTIAADVRPYTPGLVLWSDGASKDRWIWLPPQSKIDTTNMDEWQFPAGTKIWKAFTLAGNPIETRLLWKQTDLSWSYVVYRWSSDLSQARRLDTGETNVNGTTYEVPAVRDCPTCHRGRTDVVLGFDLVGTGIAGAQGVTLATLVNEGRLTQAPPSWAVTLPEDATGKAAAALGWLHVNCGVSCHNANPDAKASGSNLYHKLLASQLFPTSGAPVVESVDTYTTAVNVSSNMTPNGHPYPRISPGHSTDSLVPLMAGVRAPNNGAFQPMPPLVSHQVDAADLAQLYAWIDALHAVPIDAGADANDASVQDATIGTDSGSDGGVADAGSDTGASADAGGQPTPGSVYQYHNHINRDGQFIDSAITMSTAATFHRDTSFAGTFSGHVYASPIYVADGPGERGTFFIATESNNVYAIDETTGNVVWQQNVGRAASQSGAGCGNIKPIGITGTPAIDPGTRTIIFDAAIANSAGNGIQTHTMFGLSIDDGSQRWSVDLSNVSDPSGNGFSPTVQNQRGGILLLNGYAYAIFGGHIGDCADYHGWVIGVPIDGNASRVNAWRSRAVGDGIWAPAGASSDGTSIFFTTGNAKGSPGWQDSEAVFKLGANLAAATANSDFFVPSNWQDMDDQDLDMSGSTPLLIDVPGMTPSQLVMAQGKDGNLYLLDRNNMGGVGAAPLGQLNVMSGDISNAGAWATTVNGTYVVVRPNLHGSGVNCPNGTSGDLVGIKIDPNAPGNMTLAWCADSGGGGSPIITTSDGRRDAIAWAAGTESSNLLHAWNLETGAVVFNGGGASIPHVRHFTTPIAVHGRIIVGGDGILYALKP